MLGPAPLLVDAVQLLLLSISMSMLGCWSSSLYLLSLMANNEPDGGLAMTIAGVLPNQDADANLLLLLRLMLLYHGLLLLLLFHLLLMFPKLLMMILGAKKPRIFDLMVPQCELL